MSNPKFFYQILLSVFWVFQFFNQEIILFFRTLQSYVTALSKLEEPVDLFLMRSSGKFTQFKTRILCFSIMKLFFEIFNNFGPRWVSHFTNSFSFLGLSGKKYRWRLAEVELEAVSWFSYLFPIDLGCNNFRWKIVINSHAGGWSLWRT